MNDPITCEGSRFDVTIARTVRPRVWRSFDGELRTDAQPCQACRMYGEPASAPCADCGAFTFSSITNIPDGYRFDAGALRRLRRRQKGSPK